tara:strand:- start:434 stop:544 length:111 start_codon:yes stop_codon:yes gene_type:complete
MPVHLKKARPNDNKWEKLLYKLELLIDRLERLLKRI